MSNESTVSFWKPILLAWSELLLSREAMLLRSYRHMAASLGQPIADGSTLSGARRHVVELLPQLAQLSEQELETHEKQLVLGNRLIALWLVMWTTVLPTSLMIACMWYLQQQTLDMAFQSGQGPIAILHRIVVWITLALALFFLFYFASLLIQGFFARPFTAWLNRVLRTPLNRG